LDYCLQYHELPDSSCARGKAKKKWNPGLVMTCLQFVVSINAADFVTVNRLTNPIIWWASTVVLSGLVHAVLFRMVLKD